MGFIQVDVKKEIDEMIRDLNDEDKALFNILEQEMNFKIDLIKKRESVGYTIERMIKETGLTKKEIEDIEKVQHKTSILNIIKYLNVLGLDLNKIF